MIEGSPRPEPSLFAVGAGFLLLLLGLVLATIVAVVADDTPPAPALEELPIVDGVEVVDSMATCDDTACDGYGVLLMGVDGEALAGRSRLVRDWRSRGWEPVPCADDGDGICLGDHDLRISVRDWAEVDPVMAPTLVEGVAARGLPADHLLYVRYYRCGAIYPCG